MFEDPLLGGRIFRFEELSSDHFVFVLVLSNRKMLLVCFLCSVNCLFYKTKAIIKNLTRLPLLECETLDHMK